jgi:hypothetical protein
VHGDVVWPQVLADAAGGALQPVYEAGRVDAERLPRTWKRSRCLVTLRSRLTLVLMSKLYRQMYANTGSRQPTALASAARTGGPA